jgi:predicted NUDIX family NTP pyrophosphohydrolase
MARISAGLLMFRARQERRIEVLLVHPGGPFWARKDKGAWFIPKGEIDPEEDALEAAKREFHEETGLLPKEPLFPLGTVRHRGGKTVYAWAFEGDCDPTAIRSNTFMMEWPPRSGRRQEFPEIDRAQFFGLEEAREHIHPDEAEFLTRLYDLCLQRKMIISS